MSRKNVTVTISKPPHGNDSVVEGLRMAVGLCAGADEHDVCLIFTGDGIFNLMSDIVWPDAVVNCWRMMKKLNLEQKFVLSPVKLMKLWEQ